MTAFKSIRDTHPNLSEDDCRLLMCLGYSQNQDMDAWTQTIKDNTIDKLMNVISLIKSQQDGN